MKRLAINNPWQDAPVFFKSRTGSTMEDALTLYRNGYPGGTVVAAGFQEQGRGRFPRRVWKSRPDENLLFTLLLVQDLAFSATRLPVLMGLALSQTVEDLFDLKTRVKWPNDVLFGEKKLAGILCEAHPPAILVGIGLNCNQRIFPEELKSTVCSLRQALGRAVDTVLLLERILSSICSSLEDTDWKEKLLSRLYLLNERIVIARGLDDSGPKEVHGILKGLNEDGALLIQLEDSSQLVSIFSGEVRKT